MKKLKLFDPDNVLRTLKVWVVAIVLGIVQWVIHFLIVAFAGLKAVGYTLMFVWLIFTLFLFGYLLKKWWKWN